MKKSLAHILLSLALLTSVAGAHATVASDIASGMPADVVIANGLASGMSIDDLMDAVAREVGSGNIGLFAGSAMRVLAAATGSDASDVDVSASVNAAIGKASAAGYGSNADGQSYAMNGARFAPQPTASIVGITGILALPTMSTRSGGAPAGQGSSSGSGGGGGGNIEDALCEIVGSEPGCLDAA